MVVVMRMTIVGMLIRLMMMAMVMMVVVMMMVVLHCRDDTREQTIRTYMVARGEAVL